MTKKKWVWMPHPGHFIGSRDCRFHLNTYIGKYIISTVGEYWPDQMVRRIHANVYDPEWYLKNQDKKGDMFDSIFLSKFGYHDIGVDRKYETMVFKATKSKNECCPYSASDWLEIDMEGYNSADDATKGHLKMCNKWSKK